MSGGIVGSLFGGGQWSPESVAQAGWRASTAYVHAPSENIVGGQRSAAKPINAVKIGGWNLALKRSLTIFYCGVL